MARPNLFQRIWNLLTTPLRRYFRGRQNSVQQFTSVAGRLSKQQRNFDLEVGEIPVRDRLKAQELIEIRENCPEAGTAIAIISDDCFSSADGDDYGVVVSEEDVQGDRLDPEVYEIASNCLRQVLQLSTLKKVVDRMVSYGDCFGEMIIETRKADRGVKAIQLLPTWEMFRVEDRGILQQFEQRRMLIDNSPVVFTPAEVVHWRYQHDFLYGRSQWAQSVPDWVNLKKALHNYMLAGNDIGTNPTVHIAPEGTDSEWIQNYRRIHQDRLKDGPETHMYMGFGGDVRKLANNDPNLSALREQVELFTRRLVGRSRVPSWMLNIYEVGARDLSNQPSLAWSRFINGIRGDLSEGIKQVLYTDLIVKGVPVDRWKGLIKLSYPKIYVDVYQGQEVDLAESDEHPDTEPRSQLRVVGSRYGNL